MRSTTRISGGRKRWRTRGVALIALLLCPTFVVLSVGGCKDPWGALMIRTESGFKTQAKLTAPNGDVTVRLVAGGNFYFPYRDQYSLTLGVEARAKDGGEPLVIHPDRVEVLFEGSAMSLSRTVVEKPKDTASLSKKKLLMEFECQPRLDTTTRARTSEPQGAEILIILDGLVEYGPDPVPFDTLFAIDRKAQRHEYELTRPR